MEIKKRIAITFDCINNAIGIEENDFTPLESLGMLEAAKGMITLDWLTSCECEGCQEEE